MNITNIQQLESIASTKQIQQFLHYIFEDIYLYTLLKRFRLVYKNKKINKLNNSIFNLSDNDKQIIINKSFQKFKQYVINNDKYTLEINNNFIYQLIDKYLPDNINKYIQQLIQQYNKDIDNNSITEMNELSLTNIPIGKSINLNSSFYENLHKFFIQPVIYVNGNIIGADEKFTVDNYVEAINSTRMYHFNLLDEYIRNKRKNHNNDIKSIPRECTRSDIEEQDLILKNNMLMLE